MKYNNHFQLLTINIQLRNGTLKSLFKNKTNKYYCTIKTNYLGKEPYRQRKRSFDPNC
jgi:hypothetical protein